MGKDPTWRMSRRSGSPKWVMPARRWRWMTSSEGPAAKRLCRLRRAGLAKGKDGRDLRPAVDDRYLGHGLSDRPAQGGRHRGLPTTWEDIRKDSEAVHKKDRQDRLRLPGRQLRFGALCGSWPISTGGRTARNDRAEARTAPTRIGLTPADVTESMNYYKKFMDEGDNPRAEPRRQRRA